MSAVGDARKRHAEQHHTHPDPAVRELIARAEARGAERVAEAVEALLTEYRRSCNPAPYTSERALVERLESLVERRDDDWEEAWSDAADADDTCGAGHPYAGRPCTRPAGHDAAGGHSNGDRAWFGPRTEATR